MKITPRGSIPGLYDIDLAPFSDHRGVLCKLFNDPTFHEQGVDLHFRQILHSQTTPKNTLRGMYVQRAPFTEAKMIYPIKGKLVWVVVDARKGSPTLGQAEVVELEGGKPRAFLASPGFAHGSLTLDDDVHVLLAGTNTHSEEHGLGFAWNDPELNIPWPLIKGEPMPIAQHHDGYGSFKDFVAKWGGV
jgi:dTDP-4-dehydrorhamnose 3,5-epimerase